MGVLGWLFGPGKKGPANLPGDQTKVPPVHEDSDMGRLREDLARWQRSSDMGRQRAKGGRRAQAARDEAAEKHNRLEAQVLPLLHEYLPTRSDLRPYPFLELYGALKAVGVRCTKPELFGILKQHNYTVTYPPGEPHEMNRSLWTKSE